MAASCEQPLMIRVDTERVHGIQALLQPDAPLLKPGDVLPPLWHWIALARWPDVAVTGHDGHPRRPEGLEDTPTRRMFAGGEVTFAQVPARVGEQVTVQTELGDVVQKSGRSGDFVLATFTTTVRNLAGKLVISEQQNVVYTDPRPADLGAPDGALPVVGRPLVARADGSVDLLTDPTVLLRFSALTANAHRIHYDLGYAREVEKLPGLLVHGPLINLALAELARTASHGRVVRRVRHRNLSPLFVGQPAVLAATTTAPDEITAEATSDDGRTTSRVVVDFHEEDKS